MAYDMCFIGYGISTRGALKCFLEREGGKGFVSSTNPLSEKDKSFLNSVNVEWEEGVNSNRCLTSKQIIVSPGVPPSNPVLIEADRQSIRVMSDFDYIVSYFPKSLKTIGITGTNGKTTTVELTNHLLSQLFHSVAAGNIGTSPADIVLEDRYYDLDFAVFELSSFQLFYTHTPFLDIAALLNITTDHLTWHGTFEHYRQAKQKIFALRKSESLYNYCITKKEYASASGTQFIIGDVEGDDVRIIENPRSILIKNVGTINFTDFPLKGKHNTENAAFASFIASSAGVPPAMIEKGLKSFVVSEHRLEEFLNNRGVKYINDSKSTNADSSVQAIRTFSNPGRRLLLLLGGRGKGEDYTTLTAEIVKNCGKVYLCGENVPLLFPLLDGQVQCESFSSWEEAIRKCIKEVKSGDTVLFSPGGSSFDFFNHYKERGEFFKNTCKRLLGL
jgi:UDP-N-acetylmuramoylalanine--D-glutamate ligase